METAVIVLENDVRGTQQVPDGLQESLNSNEHTNSDQRNDNGDYQRDDNDQHRGYDVGSGASQAHDHDASSSLAEPENL